MIFYFIYLTEKLINNKIYLFIYYTPTTAGSARINAKKREMKERRVRRARKRKGIEAQGVKPSTPSQATDALIGDEEQTGKQKKKYRR